MDISTMGEFLYFTSKLSQIAKEVLPDNKINSNLYTAQIVIQNAELDGLNCEKISIQNILDFSF